MDCKHFIYQLVVAYSFRHFCIEFRLLVQPGMEEEIGCVGCCKSGCSCRLECHDCAQTFLEESEYCLRCRWWRCPPCHKKHEKRPHIESEVCKHCNCIVTSSQLDELEWCISCGDLVCCRKGDGQCQKKPVVYYAEGKKKSFSVPQTPKSHRLQTQITPPPFTDARQKRKVEHVLAENSKKTRVLNRYAIEFQPLRR